MKLNIVKSTNTTESKKVRSGIPSLKLVNTSSRRSTALNYPQTNRTT